MESSKLIFIILCVLSLIREAYADSQARHMGVASCASSVCHGSVSSKTQLHIAANEYYIWSVHDPHAQAYQSLDSALGKQIAGKLNIAKASEHPACLACHTDYVDKKLRGKRYLLSDGVGCEACHGASEHWLASHYRSSSTRSDSIAKGMLALDNLHIRAQKCNECHLGTADKFADHAMMAAGHPRLRFELNTYVSTQPAHFVADADYLARKEAYTPVVEWIAGQLNVAIQSLQNIQHHFENTQSVFPEWALFDCYSCHRSIDHIAESKNTQQRFHRQTLSSNPQFNLVAIDMLNVICQSLGLEQDAKQMTAMRGRLLQAVNKNKNTLLEELDDSLKAINSLKARLPTKLNQQHVRKILASLLNDEQSSSFLQAEQQVMAIETLLIELKKQRAVESELAALVSVIQQVDKFTQAKFFQTKNELGESLIEIERSQ